MSPHTLSKRLPSKRRLAIALGGIVCFGLILLCMLSESLGRWSAYRLVPPPYPAAVVLSQEQFGGSGGSGEITLYTTPDDIDTVFAFMEQHMPGFTGTSETRFLHEVCDASPLLDLTDHLLVTSPFARCASVSIYREPSANATFIRVVVRWASG